MTAIDHWVRGAIPRASNHYGRAESLQRSPKSPNNVTSTFFHSRFASDRPQVGTWGRQTCFLPRAPSNLVTSLDWVVSAQWRTEQNASTIDQKPQPQFAPKAY